MTLKPGRRDGLLIPEREYVLYLDEVKGLSNKAVTVTDERKDSLGPTQLFYMKVNNNENFNRY